MRSCKHSQLPGYLIQSILQPADFHEQKKKSYAAVKAVAQKKLSKKLKENLESEIRILKSLQHPHIVALFACTETPEYIYLVMEYCQLSDLAQFMKKRNTLSNYPEVAAIFQKYPNQPAGGLNEVVARHFIKQVASALEYLRVRNLVHRDIKPQNLLLNPSPTFMQRQKPEDVPLAASEYSLVSAVGLESLPMLKIADFGFARHLPSTSLAETLCGSPLYMAPEILRYEKYDARADLWSTGAVLHEMVVGKPPFRASNHVELLRKIEKAEDQIVFDRSKVTISREMKNLIRALLKKAPVERMTYEDFFTDPVVVGEIPGLVGEDRPKVKTQPTPDPQVSELSRRMQKQAIGSSAQDYESPEPTLQARRSRDKVPTQNTSKLPAQDTERLKDGVVGRPSSSNAQRRVDSGTGDAAPIDIQRQTSGREQRRPSMVAHATAPARQELLLGQASPKAHPLERRASKHSPLADPPMIRERLSAEAVRQQRQNERALREVRERAAEDMKFEKDYVVIEKKAVEVNAFADEMEAAPHIRGNYRGSPQPQGNMIRRATTQGGPTSITGAQPSSPSRALQSLSGRPQPLHQRNASYDRRYVPGPTSATNMLTKVMNAANARLFGALGTSPPFAMGGHSPPHGYSAFPAYPAPQGTLLLGDGQENKPMDEDTRILRIMEEAATRSNVIYGFAEVKYQQLLPAPPSTEDGLGIRQIGAQEKGFHSSDETEDQDMTNIAIVGVAEEGLVLYVKTLAILAKSIDLAGYWWGRQGRGEIISTESASPRNDSRPGTSEIGKRMNHVVQWARARFNECLEKSEVVGRRLLEAQKQLPPDHPGNPNNHPAASTSSAGSIGTSADHIQLTSGVTAEKLMFDRAVEMSRGAALSELVGEDLRDCDRAYSTAIMLLEAVLEGDDEPLLRKPSTKKEKAGDELINGVEDADRQAVLNREFTQMFRPAHTLTFR